MLQLKALTPVPTDKAGRERATSLSRNHGHSGQTSNTRSLSCSQFRVLTGYHQRHEQWQSMSYQTSLMPTTSQDYTLPTFDISAGACLQTGPLKCFYGSILELQPQFISQTQEGPVKPFHGLTSNGVQCCRPCLTEQSLKSTQTDPAFPQRTGYLCLQNSSSYVPLKSPLSQQETHSLTFHPLCICKWCTIIFK